MALLDNISDAMKSAKGKVESTGLKAKYQPLLDLGEKLGIKDGGFEVVGDKLKIWGTADKSSHKDQLLEMMTKIGGDNPTDIIHEIKVTTSTYTVKPGDSLSKIAKAHYGNAQDYMKIFNANTDILKDPNMIHPGQELTIPE